MSWLRQLIQGHTVDPTDERYWQAGSSVSTAGIRVTPEAALKISTVWACVGIIADTVAWLPTIVYRRLADGGKERAVNHPLYDVLHLSPNRQQTAFEFYQMMTAHMLLRGNAYAQIVPGPRGPADQLIPLHPDRVFLEDLPDGTLRYRVVQADGAPRYFLDDEILHLRGMTLDGKTGLSVVTYARESLGLALAAEKYGGKFWVNDSTPGGVLQSKTKLNSDAQARLKASWNAAHSGAGGAHSVAVLEDGLEWKAVGLSQKDAQFLESREFQSEDIARWFRVPGHMVGLTAKTTSWGSGIEQLGIGFVTYTLMPWLTRWQQGISRDLIIAPNVYFVEWLVDALLRGDQTSRYGSYATGRQWGWLSPNDVRRYENMNPIPGGDDYLTPLNMQPVGAGGASSGHYQQLLNETASRIARKETAALSKHRPDWPESVAEFYRDHGAFVSQTLHIPAADAAAYVAQRQAQILLAGGPDAVATQEAAGVAQLLNLVEAMR